jgi:hypothetical protein
VAYLPDQFGHISQMPQILASAGFEVAAVWRGVPSEVTGTGFVWRSPDGSSVSALYLPFGYGQGTRMPREARAFRERVAEEIARTEPFLRADEAFLLMAGDDHEEPDPGLPEMVRHLREEGYEAAITSLGSHVGAWEVPDVTVTGELRSAARANLLPNTYSARVHQKFDRARAEHLLERYAEPLAALVTPDRWPAQALEEAWSLLHLNGAHDSVCGCSMDAVARAVDGRTARAAVIAEGVARGALQTLAHDVSEPGTIAFNPSPFERVGVPGLGWAVVDPGVLEPVPVGLAERGGRAVATVAGGEIAVRIEDRDDEGDLYTFSPAGEPAAPTSVSSENGGVLFRFEGCDVLLRASAGAGDEGFVRFTADIDNRAVDHRVRALVALPHTAATSLAGSPFDLVRRPLQGEGGPTEPGSTCWPARGFVTAGGGGFLSEAVVEYELLGDELALTLMRCTGTISRPGPIPARSLPAGPDVPTPEAQMLGGRRISFGVLTEEPGASIVDVWERYALAPIAARSPGGGRRRSPGTLLEVAAPALSSVRFRAGRVQVGVFNPFDDAAAAEVGGRRLELGPHRIERVDVG